MNAAEARDRINIFYGNPLDVLSSCLRGFLIAPPGKEFIAVDFSSIEARVLAWLAGEETVLEIFRTHGKIYEFTAAKIFGVLIDQITKHDWRRQIGKVSELALGYQGGVGALQTMCKGYNVTLAPAHDILWASATLDNRTRAANMADYNFEKTKKTNISRAEFIASELIKLAWRDSHPNTVHYWDMCDKAAIAAVQNPQKKFTIGPGGRQLTFFCNGPFMWVKLPSGRVLSYPYPRIEMVDTPWGSSKATLTCMGEDSTTHQFKRQKLYGGLLVENFTQAVARDCLKDLMLDLRKDNFDIVMHVHDEAMLEQTIGVLPLSVLEDRASAPPLWAKDLPVEAKGFIARRYRK